jgi:hypothetical protein
MAKGTAILGGLDLNEKTISGQVFFDIRIHRKVEYSAAAEYIPLKNKTRRMIGGAQFE